MIGTRSMAAWVGGMLALAACGPGIAGSRGVGQPYACEGNRLLRVTDDGDATIEVHVQENHAWRQVGTVIGRGERTFQVPSEGYLGVQLRPVSREQTRYQVVCG